MKSVLEEDRNATACIEVFDSDDEWEDGDNLLLENIDTPENQTESVITQKRKRIILTKEDIEQRRDIVKSRLKQFFERMLLVAKWTFADDTMAWISSVLPDQFDNLYGKPLQLSIVQDLVEWFRRSFDVVDNKSVSFSEGRDGCSLSDGLSNVLQNACGTHTQLVQLFVAMLHSLHCSVRFVCTIDPPVSASSALAADGLFDGYVLPLTWAEVQLPSNSSDSPPSPWINVDPIRGIVGDKLCVERLCRPRRSALAYVFGVDASGRVEDVTAAYSLNPSRTRQKRLKEGPAASQRECMWWLPSMDHHQTSLPDNEEGGESLAVTTKKCRESDTNTPAAAHTLPTSLSACRSHPVYTLGGKHLGKHRVLRPGARPVGVVDGQLLYARSDVSALLTAFEWKKEGDPDGVGRRVVMDGEAPYVVRLPRRAQAGGVRGAHRYIR